MFIYYNLHQYINNYDVVLVDNLESFETKEIKLCLLNEKNEFEILDINIPNNIKEEEYIIKLLDDYRNSLPLGYRSPLYDTLQNEKIERVKNVINPEEQEEVVEEEPAPEEIPADIQLLTEIRDLLAGKAPNDEETTEEETLEKQE